MPDLLTTSQVQAMLRVDRTTIYRMVEDGRLPAVRVGKQWRFRRDEIERWLQAQASPAAAPAGASGSQPLVNGPVPASLPLADLLPLGCVQLVQDAFAEMLGASLIITDMQGEPVTQASNLCGFFAAATRRVGGVAACTNTWQRLAGGVAMEPRFVEGDLGLLCTRGLIRVGAELKGMVVLGGIAPDDWPPAQEKLAAMAGELGLEPAALEARLDEVYRLDGYECARALRFVQRIADVVAHMVEDRGLMVGKLQAIASLTAL